MASPSQEKSKKHVLGSTKQINQTFLDLTPRLYIGAVYLRKMNWHPVSERLEFLYSN